MITLPRMKPEPETVSGWPATLEAIRELDRETRDARPTGDDRAAAPSRPRAKGAT